MSSIIELDNSQVKPNKKGVATVELEKYGDDVSLEKIDNKKIKSINIIGGSESNYLIGSKYADVIKTGAGSDVITAGKGNDKIYSGAGNNTFYFEKGDGKDVIYDVKAGDNIRITLDNDMDEYDIQDMVVRKGNDLVITYTPEIKKGKKVVQNADSITLAGFFSGTPSSNIAEIEFIMPNDSYDLDLDRLYSVAGKGKINGTNYDDMITGSKSNDTITTGAGSDGIFALKGNDKIIINGDGTKNIYINQGDGNDTVVVSDDVYGADINIDLTGNNAISYSQGKDGVVVHRTYVNGQSVKTETTTVISDTDEFSVNGNEYDEMTATEFIGGKSNKDNKNLASMDQDAVIVGGDKKDTVNSSYETDDIIFTGKGNDTINILGSRTTAGNTVIAGGGNDTINIDTDEEAVNQNNTLIFNNGDGNDVVNIKDVNAVTALNFADVSDPTTLSFALKDQDLAISRTFKKGKKNVTETVTLKANDGGFSIWNDTVLTNTKINGETLKDLLDANGVAINGIYNKEYKETMYSGSGEFGAIMTHSNNTNASMWGGTNDDTYNINNFSKKSGTVMIGDSAGNENLNIKANAQDLRLLFNVDSEGEVVYTEPNYTPESNTPYWANDLLIFNKDTFNIGNYNKLESTSKGIAAKGVIDLQNYFVTPGVDPTSDINANNIENISVKGSDISTQINIAKQEIADRVGNYLYNLTVEKEIANPNYDAELAAIAAAGVYNVSPTIANPEYNAELAAIAQNGYDEEPTIANPNYDSNKAYVAEHGYDEEPTIANPEYDAEAAAADPENYKVPATIDNPDYNAELAAIAAAGVYNVSPTIANPNYDADKAYVAEHGYNVSATIDNPEYDKDKAYVAKYGYDEEPTILSDVPKYATAYELLQKGTKAEKNELLSIYSSVKIGSEANEKFTSTKADEVFISGKGNDTFVFGGKFGDDVIISESDAVTKNTDTIQFKDAAYSKGQIDFWYDSDGRDLEIFITGGKSKGSYLGYYGLGDTNLTIKDATATYAVEKATVETSATTGFSKDWSDEKAKKGKTNVDVLVVENNSDKKATIASSNVGYHNVTIDSSYAPTNEGEIIASTEFNYNGGHDYYTTVDSNDTYKVAEFTKSTDLLIYDCGGNDNLVIEGHNFSDLSLFFNIDQDGYSDSDMYILGKESNRSYKTNKDFINAVQSRKGGVIQVGGYESYCSLEKINGTDIAYKVNEIKSNVSSWLAEHTDYDTAFDAIATCKDKVAVSELIACYNVAGPDA